MPVDMLGGQMFGIPYRHMVYRVSVQLHGVCFRVMISADETSLIFPKASQPEHPLQHR